MNELKHYPAEGRGLKIDFSAIEDYCNCGYVMKMTVRAAILATLEYEGFPYDAQVSVSFYDNAEIQKLTQRYRNKDSATDVLSFPLFESLEEMGEEGDTVMLGDIVLSLERTQEQAKELEHSFLRELAFLCIHSTLHLLGYDHERSAAEEEIMCDKQRAILAALEIQ